jgi:hypothetical protein
MPVYDVFFGVWPPRHTLQRRLGRSRQVKNARKFSCLAGPRRLYCHFGRAIWHNPALPAIEALAGLRRDP